MGFNYAFDCKVMFCSVFFRNYAIVSFFQTDDSASVHINRLSRAGTDSVKSWRRLISGEL